MGDNDAYPDAALWEALRQGADQQAFTDLFERYHRVVFEFCLEHLVDDGAAREATAATFDHVWAHAREHKLKALSAGSVTGHLLWKARRVCVDQGVHFKKTASSTSPRGWDEILAGIVAKTASSSSKERMLWLAASAAIVSVVIGVVIAQWMSSQTVVAEPEVSPSPISMESASSSPSPTFSPSATSITSLEPAAIESAIASFDPERDLPSNTGPTRPVPSVPAPAPQQPKPAPSVQQPSPPAPVPVTQPSTVPQPSSPPPVEPPAPSPDPPPPPPSPDPQPSPDPPPGPVG